MKKLLIILIVTLTSCSQSIKVTKQGNTFISKPPKVKYPIETELVYKAPSGFSSYKLYRTKRGRLFYYEINENYKTRRVYLRYK